MIETRFLRVLRQLYNKLPEPEVHWALTGSLSLRIQEVDVTVRDVDIQTDEPGAYEIERRFADSVIRKVAFSSTEKIRSYFGKLNIEGTEVEILGDIQNPLPNGTWTQPADIPLNREFIDIDGMSLPVMPLEYEYHAYVRLGKIEKAEKIKRHLKQGQVK